LGLSRSLLQPHSKNLLRAPLEDLNKQPLNILLSVLLQDKSDVPLGTKSASAAIHQECSQPFEHPSLLLSGGTIAVKRRTVL